jgi:methionyl-tRNA formyltransferase
VKDAALRLGIAVSQPGSIKNNAEFRDQLTAIKPDAIIVVGYGRIIPQWMIDLPRLGNLNLHASLLPKYRGAAPIQWAIADGEPETGVTIMKMDAGLDTGPILSTCRTPILPTDDSQILHDRLAQLGAELLAETIPDYAAGKILPQPQPAEGSSYAAKIKKEDGKIDWNEPAGKILNRLRAFTPWPGAFTFLKTESKTQLLKIWKGGIAEEIWRRNKTAWFASRELGPGTILSADKNGIIVSCGIDLLHIMELQREGGRRLTAEQFLIGFPLKAGAKFEW